MPATLLPLPCPPSRSVALCRRGARDTGLTLVEFMVVVAILGLLVATGAPSLSRTLDAAGVAAASREYCAALRFARSEALRRGAWVTVCARAPGVGPPACAASVAPGWVAGWLVFTDDGERARLDGDDALLRLQGSSSRVTGADGTLRALTFGAGGVSVDAASHVLFRAADASVLQLVCVSKTGRPRLAPPGRTNCTGTPE